MILVFHRFSNMVTVHIGLIVAVLLGHEAVACEGAVSDVGDLISHFAVLGEILSLVFVDLTLNAVVFFEELLDGGHFFGKLGALFVSLTYQSR